MHSYLSWNWKLKAADELFEMVSVVKNFDGDNGNSILHPVGGCEKYQQLSI